MLHLLAQESKCVLVGVAQLCAFLLEGLLLLLYIRDIVFDAVLNIDYLGQSKFLCEFERSQLILLLFLQLLLELFELAVIEFAQLCLHQLVILLLLLFLHF